MLSYATCTRESVSATSLQSPKVESWVMDEGKFKRLHQPVGARVRLMDDNHWWKERLEAWSHEGFDVTSFRESLRAEPSLASELLIQFDAMVSRNRTLRRRVIDSSVSREKKGRWLGDLDDVANTDSLLENWEKDAAANRPWEPYAHRAEERWAERDRRSNLTAIVKRLNALDPSSFSACQPLLILFDDVSSENLINSMLDEIESDEARRREVVGEMIDLLSRDGIDASSARRMKISDALDHLTSLQSKADEARMNRLKIEKEIRPFDEELADRLLAKERGEITEEVDAIIGNLSSRLSALNNTVDEWKEMGIIFPNKSEIPPHELLDWEAGLPEIEKTVQIHLRALERWSDFESLWPDRCQNSTIAGRLELTEEFIDLVDSLDQEWRELELEGMQIINAWEDLGFAMDSWRTRLAEEPRSAIAWLKREEEKYSAASTLIDALMALDASIDGEEEILRRVAILREFDLDRGLLEETGDFVDSRARRGARHRSMLESEWMQLVRSGLAEDTPTGVFSLAEFETLISDTRLNKQHSGIPIERLEGRIKEEIDTWYENGFSVDVINEMLEENPVGLALRIVSMREAVAGHETLRRRVSNLDWTRDPELSISVNLELSRPDRLEALAANIPQLMMSLAQKDVVDEHFSFIAWRPRKRSRPMLIPVPQNTVEDAMEAILEEMDSSEEEIVEPIVETVQEVIEEKEIVSPEPIVEIEAEAASEITVIEEVPEAVEEVDVVPEAVEEDEDVEEFVPEIEIIEPSSSENSTPSGGDSASLVKLLRALGLEDEANLLEDNEDLSLVRRALASHVGIEPRDMRLDRLLRLALRLIPNGDESDGKKLSLLATLADLADGLSKWTRTRLEARHNGSEGVLLNDAIALGKALERTPGPGTMVPLDADEFELPASDDTEGLANEVNVLKRRVMLSSSGGVR